MQGQVEKRSIEVDAKVTQGIRLPSSMILYAVAVDHFVISAKPLKNLEDSALTKTPVKVLAKNGKVRLELGEKIYDFCHLDENDNTVMVSEKDPSTITITI